MPAWGHRSIKDIRRHDVLVLMDTIADRGAIIMARRVVAYVHRLFRWAVSRGIIDSNPASDLPKPGKEIRRDRVLTDNELKEVWRASEELGWPYGSALQLLILTGARRAEISELRWSEVNGDTISLKGSRTKNGEPRNIPLTAPALKSSKGHPACRRKRVRFWKASQGRGLVPSEENLSGGCHSLAHSRPQTHGSDRPTKARCQPANHRGCLRPHIRLAIGDRRDLSAIFV